MPDNLCSMYSPLLKEKILNLPRLIKKLIAVSLDALISTFTVWVSFGLLQENWGWFSTNQLWTLFIAIGLALPMFIFFGFYKTIFRFVGISLIASMAWVILGYSLLFYLVMTVCDFRDVPHSVRVIQPILFFLGILLSRYFLNYFLNGRNKFFTSSTVPRPAALIYGAGLAGRQLLAALAVNKEISIKAFIDDNVSKHGNTIDGIWIYGPQDIEKLISRFGVSDVLLAIPSADQTRRREIIAFLEGREVRVRTLPGLLEMASGRVRYSDLHDLDMNDLLGRQVIPPDFLLLEKNITNKVVLVTGAGGSIGGELCRQIIRFSPQSLVLVESSEHALYSIHEELKMLINGENVDSIDRDSWTKTKTPCDLQIQLMPCLASVRDADSMLRIFSLNTPDTVFHTAAYKHVPIVEENPGEGIWNNVWGTLVCANASIKVKVSSFTLVSTDKAVRPTNVMGASKRVAELVLQALADSSRIQGWSTCFSMVRFGNVLGSSGSVAPLFSSQIKMGGPITLTHPDITRYFMTIPEAAQLVIQSSSMAKGGDVFVLDMGDPVRIYDLAVKMVYLSGFLLKNDSNPLGDIEIKVTGLRPGEKLYEELLIGGNPEPTAHPKIMKAHEDFLPWDHLELELEKLNSALKSGDHALIRRALKNMVPSFHQSL